jgi:glycosyltransferase involved in cell wall biosynthesis
VTSGTRLAILLPDMGGGGAERVALALIRCFAAQGHQVDLLLLRAEGDLLKLIPPGVRVIDLHAPRLRSALPALVRYLKQERPFALQASMWPLTVIAILSRMLARVPTRLVVSDHTILSLQYAMFGKAAERALRLTTRLFYRKADARVGVSRKVAEDVAQLARLPVSAIDVIYNPLEPATRGGGEDKMPVWPAGGRRILSVGSLKAEKNYPLLVRAFARIAREQDVSLVILGEGPLRPAVAAAIKAAAIEDRVKLPGFVSDPGPWYASANLFVLSSDFEGFGNVVVEAMRHGLPVVSTDSGGPGEILDGGRYGRIVPVGDEAALAAAMRVALDCPGDANLRKARAEALSGAQSAHQYLRLMIGADHESWER